MGLNEKDDGGLERVIFCSLAQDVSWSIVGFEYSK